MLYMFLEHNKGILFVRLEGNLIRETSYKINSYLIPVIIKQKIKKIVININKLEKIDLTGYEALINLRDASKEVRGEIYFSNNNEKHDQLLNKLHVNKVNNDELIFNFIGA